jgi:hypothetical protein
MEKRMPPKVPIRMKDIAADLGVSLMTVSKGLRNQPDIGEATRQRVLKRATELNYLPNVNARSLATGKSSLIGLVVPDLLHPFFADIAHGLSMALRQEGYFLIVTSSEEDPDLEQERDRAASGPPTGCSGDRVRSLKRQVLRTDCSAGDSLYAGESLYID